MVRNKQVAGFVLTLLSGVLLLTACGPGEAAFTETPTAMPTATAVACTDATLAAWSAFARPIHDWTVDAILQVVRDMGDGIIEMETRQVLFVAEDLIDDHMDYATPACLLGARDEAIAALRLLSVGVNHLVDSAYAESVAALEQAIAAAEGVAEGARQAGVEGW